MEPLRPLARPPLPDKDYFNIGEASRIAQVPEYTLRYWKTRFGMLRPVRRESGHRRNRLNRVKKAIAHRWITSPPKLP